MLELVLRAILARKAQTVILLVLAGLAAAAAAAGPWYALAATSRSASADVAAASPAQRSVSLRQIADPNGDPRAALNKLATTVRQNLRLPGDAPTLGMSQSTTVRYGRSSAGIGLDYRDELCAHLRIAGACPQARGEAVVSRTVAATIGATTGTSISLRAPSSTPVVVRVVGLYDFLDPAGGYWSNDLYRNPRSFDPIFTTLETFADRQLGQPTLSVDIDVPEALIRGDDGFDLAATLREANSRLEPDGIDMVNPTGPILATIARDRDALRQGVLVALGEVLVLALFAIGLAGRYTVRDRRGDAALLKLRGNTRFGLVTLMFGQHLVPLLGGAIVGAPAGVLVSWALAGRLPVPAEVPLALLLSACAVGVVVVGGLLVLIAVDALVLRQPVVTLLRRVPSGRRDWRSDLVDLMVLAVAAGAVYQARSGAASDGVALVAPVLVALAVALLLARLLSRIADRAGAGAVRRGSLRFGLTAVQVSRQPGTDRVFALIVVAVAMVATAAGGFAAGRTERVDRSEIELGAPRVLTVAADSRSALGYAVRRADPGGHYAMAAVITRASDPPVLAVDTTRLAAVARWRPEYGPIAALPDAMAALRPPPAPVITGSRLTVVLRNEQKTPTVLVLVLQNESTGVAVPVRFGPVARGEHAVSAAAPGCDQPPGCRIMRWQLQAPLRANGKPGDYPKDAHLIVRSLTQQNPDATILEKSALADIARWRADFDGTALDITSVAAGLSLAVDPNPLGAPLPGTEAFALDAPLPVPVVLAGRAPDDWAVTDPTVFAFGIGATPAQVVGTSRLVPVLGRNGILLDFETARRITGEADAGGSYQVWLSADAPPSVVDALTAGGLTILADRTTEARRAQLADQGTALALRFALVAAFLVVLLAAAVIALTAAVDRKPLADQLHALRLQGLPRRTGVTIGWAGLAGVTLAGLVGGLIAAAVAGAVAGVTAPLFTDGWRVVGPPPALGASAFAVSAAVALAVLGVTVWLAVRPLVRRLRGAAE